MHRNGRCMERSRLAQLRAKKHWSLQHAAVLLEVDVTTLNRWEHGKASPRQYNIEKLCEVYGCSEGELGLLHEMSTVEVPVAPPLFDITNESQSFLANDLTMRLLPLAFVPVNVPPVRDRRLLRRCRRWTRPAQNGFSC